MSLGQVINVPRRFVLEEWGGTETVILETAKQLKDQGYEPKILTTLALSKKPKEMIADVSIHRFGYTYTRLGLTKKNHMLLDKRGGNMFSLRLFLHALFSKSPAVIHLHTLGRVGALMRLVAKIRRIPYVVSIHGGLMDLPKKQLEDLVAPTRKSFNWGKIFDLMLPSDRLIDDADAVICVGEAEQKKLQAQYPDTPVHFLPNGVDTEYFASGKRARFEKELAMRGLRVDRGDRYVLSVGSFYPQKNQATLIRAFANLQASQGNLKLVLIGLIYDQDYYASLQSLANELGVHDKIIFLTDVSFDNETLVDAYQTAEIFVLPSLYETFGVVVLEAWAAGLPVICGAVGGLPSFVKDKRNGLFCDVDQVLSMTCSMRKLLEHSHIGDQLVARAQQDVLNYSWKRISLKLAEIYQSLYTR